MPWQPSAAAPAQPAYTGPQENSGKAIASLILGAFSMLFGILLIPGILAVVFGHMALSQIKRSAGRLKGEGMAIAGLVMGYLGFVMIPAILIIAAIAIPNLLRSRIAANEASAVGSIRTINVAEVTYAVSYPAVGFTCSLMELNGPGQPPSEKSAELIDNVLASGQKSGYRFTLSNCSGSLPTTYQVTAEPTVRGQTGQRTFCSDQSGIIRFSSTGSGEECLSSGEPLQ
ncbi:MAG: DUF4190 domain-containing protein [Terriglobales bacterium]